MNLEQSARSLLSLLMLDTSMDAYEAEVAERHILEAFREAMKEAWDLGYDTCKEDPNNERIAINPFWPDKDSTQRGEGGK